MWHSICLPAGVVVVVVGIVVVEVVAKIAHREKLVQSAELHLSTLVLHLLS